MIKNRVKKKVILFGLAVISFFMCTNFVSADISVVTKGNYTFSTKTYSTVGGEVKENIEYRTVKLFQSSDNSTIFQIDSTKLSPGDGSTTFKCENTGTIGEPWLASVIQNGKDQGYSDYAIQVAIYCIENNSGYTNDKFYQNMCGTYLAHKESSKDTGTILNNDPEGHALKGLELYEKITSDDNLEVVSSGFTGIYLNLNCDKDNCYYPTATTNKYLKDIAGLGIPENSKIISLTAKKITTGISKDLTNQEFITNIGNGNFNNVNFKIKVPFAASGTVIDVTVGFESSTILAYPIQCAPYGTQVINTSRILSYTHAKTVYKTFKVYYRSATLSTDDTYNQVLLPNKETIMENNETLLKDKTTLPNNTTSNIKDSKSMCGITTIIEGGVNDSGKEYTDYTKIMGRDKKACNGASYLSYSNKYCDIYCKEDIKIEIPSRVTAPDNSKDKTKIFSGRYFTLPDLKIKTKKTCVGDVNVAQFLKDVYGYNYTTAKAADAVAGYADMKGGYNSIYYTSNNYAKSYKKAIQTIDIEKDWEQKTDCQLIDYFTCTWTYEVRVKTPGEWNYACCPSGTCDQKTEQLCSQGDPTYDWEPRINSLIKFADKITYSAGFYTIQYSSEMGSYRGQLGDHLNVKWPEDNENVPRYTEESSIAESNGLLILGIEEKIQSNISGEVKLIEYYDPNSKSWQSVKHCPKNSLCKYYIYDGTNDYLERRAEAYNDGCGTTFPVVSGDIRKKSGGYGKWSRSGLSEEDVIAGCGIPASGSLSSGGYSKMKTQFNSQVSYFNSLKKIYSAKVQQAIKDIQACDNFYQDLIGYMVEDPQLEFNYCDQYDVEYKLTGGVNNELTVEFCPEKADKTNDFTCNSSDKVISKATKENINAGWLEKEIEYYDCGDEYCGSGTRKKANIRLNQSIKAEWNAEYEANATSTFYSTVPTGTIKKSAFEGKSVYLGTGIIPLSITNIDGAVCDYNFHLSGFSERGFEDCFPKLKEPFTCYFEITNEIIKTGHCPTCSDKYDPEDPNKTNIGIMYYYRPIDLDDVFPNSNYDASKKNLSKYRRLGSVWSTERGVETQKEIESSGEEVYTTPDYSYTLTPTQMAKIRQYNNQQEKRGYGYADFNLKCDATGLQCRSEFLDGKADGCLNNKCFTDNLNDNPNTRDVNFTLWNEVEAWK